LRSALEDIVRVDAHWPSHGLKREAADGDRSEEGNRGQRDQNESVPAAAADAMCGTKRNSNIYDNERWFSVCLARRTIPPHPSARALSFCAWMPPKSQFSMKSGRFIFRLSRCVLNFIAKSQSHLTQQSKCKLCFFTIKPTFMVHNWRIYKDLAGNVEGQLSTAGFL
jgi:hypothetical protein